MLFLRILTSICQIGHVRPFCTLATRLVRERETIIVTLIVAPQVLYKTRTEASVVPGFAIHQYVLLHTSVLL